MAPTIKPVVPFTMNTIGINQPVKNQNIKIQNDTQRPPPAAIQTSAIKKESHRVTVSHSLPV